MTPLGFEMCTRDAVQFLIDDGNETVQRPPVALAPAEKKLSRRVTRLFGHAVDWAYCIAMASSLPRRLSRSIEVRLMFCCTSLLKNPCQDLEAGSLGNTLKSADHCFAPAHLTALARSVLNAG